MTNEELNQKNYLYLKKKNTIDNEDDFLVEKIDELEEDNSDYVKTNHYDLLSYKELLSSTEIHSNNLYNKKTKESKKDITVNTTTFVDDFKKNNFKGLFQKVSLSLQITKDRDETLAPFFKLVTEASLKRIFKANRMLDFLNELEQFLNSQLFNAHEKKSFFNDQVAACLLYSLNAKNFPLARTINKYRKDKSFTNLYDYIAKKIREEEYEILDTLFELSDSVTTNNSQILRMFYSNGCRNFDKVKYFIEKYHLDINGLGNTPGTYNKHTFSHLVTQKDGTKGSIFFEEFINYFNNRIDFDIQALDAHKNKKYNLLETLMNSELEITTKLNRLSIILKHCMLSEKHIAHIVQYLVDANNDIIIKHYDNDVYDALFSHEKFNSSLYDREAFLNKLLMMDNSLKFYNTRQLSNLTVNPTSVILDKFMKNAKPALPMEQHPLITWVKFQNDYYSRDTFKSLMIFYANELADFDFKGIKINSALAKALEENGMILPERKGFFSFLRKKKPSVTKFEVVPSVSTVEETKNPSDRLEFNISLFEQVKDSDVKRYIDSIMLNAEQFDMLTNNKGDIETIHYMHTLLPKFLNKTIDNYLHFATMDEDDNAKNNVVVQLKLINKKTFEVLSQSLEYEKNQILRDGSIHHKVMQNY
jgi:hypothetical protein